MPTTTPKPLVALTDTALDGISGAHLGASKSMDSANPNLAGFRATGFFRPTPEGEGTTEHCLTSIQDDECGL